MNTKKIILLILGIALVIFSLLSLRVIKIPEEDSSANNLTFIEGSLSYPSEGIPEDVKVCVRRVSDSKEFCTQERLKDEKYVYQVGYKLEVSEGSYYVFTKRSSMDNFKGYYTEYITCGMKENCLSHKPIVVDVKEGEHAEKIDILDWEQFPEKNDYVTEKDNIKLVNPQPFQVVEPPFKVTGEARGSWYFEADFPVRIIDSEDNKITTVIAQAQGEWMTEEFVPFEANVDISAPLSLVYLVLEKDNPSGLPENVDELKIPIYLK